MPRATKPPPPPDDNPLDWTDTEWNQWAREFGVDPKEVNERIELIELVDAQTKDKPR